MTCVCYIADCLQLMGMHKAPTVSLSDILSGNIEEEPTGEEVKSAIFAEFERLGGGAVGD